MSASAAAQHQLIFTATSPRAYLDEELRSHPLAIAGFEVLRRARQADEARTRLLRVLDKHNEDGSGFRATSRYIVFVAGRPGCACPWPRRRRAARASRAR